MHISFNLLRTEDNQLGIEFSVRDKPLLNDPIAICGLPGAALVGKFAVDHLIDALAAKPLAEVCSNGLPEQVLVKDDGSASLIHNKLSYLKRPRGRDLIFFTADAQPSTPESEYELCEFVLEYLGSKHSVKELITLGAYVTGESLEETQVYAAGTDLRCASMLEKLGCRLMSQGVISGMNGLLIGLAKLKGISGYTLLGETSGLRFDGKAAQNVLRSLEKLADLKVNLEGLESRARKAQEAQDAIDRTGGIPNTRPGERNRPDYII